MPMLDDLDRELISLLTSDGRASISALAHHLGVARGTVQARVNRLVNTGAIRRFTVELSEEVAEHTVSAMCSIQLRGLTVRQAAAKVAAVPAVDAVFSTNGKWDLIVRIRAHGLDVLDETLGALRQIPGVEHTETSILLRQL